MKNPASLVKTKSDEKLWNEAKKAVRDSRGYKSVKQIKGDLDWGLVTKIYKAKKAKRKKNPAEIINMKHVKQLHKEIFGWAMRYIELCERVGEIMYEYSVSKDKITAADELSYIAKEILFIINDMLALQDIKYFDRLQMAAFGRFKSKSPTLYEDTGWNGYYQMVGEMDVFHKSVIKSLKDIERGA